LAGAAAGAFERAGQRVGQHASDAEQAVPVAVHRLVQRLVVQQLRRPLDRVDLGDLGGDDEPRGLEELVAAHVAVADRASGR
jgi:hypothetical protein